MTSSFHGHRQDFIQRHYLLSGIGRLKVLHTYLYIVLPVSSPIESHLQEHAFFSVTKNEQRTFHANDSAIVNRHQCF